MPKHVWCHLSKQQTFLLATSVVAMLMFIYHSYTIIRRHLRYEILVVHKVLFNESLPMPIISMVLASQRNANSSTPFANIRFSATFNSEPLPKWAYLNYSELVPSVLWQQIIELNIVSIDNYDYVKNNSNLWPLRVHDASWNGRSGFSVTGRINASNFVDSEFLSGSLSDLDDKDIILVRSRIRIADVSEIV